MILEVTWDSLWKFSFGLSQFHDHGPWLVCEPALRMCWFYFRHGCFSILIRRQSKYLAYIQALCIKRFILGFIDALKCVPDDVHQKKHSQSGFSYPFGVAKGR